jgi:hypothetical protein
MFGLRSLPFCGLSRRRVPARRFAELASIFGVVLCLGDVFWHGGTLFLVPIDAAISAHGGYWRKMVFP